MTRVPNCSDSLPPTSGTYAGPWVIDELNAAEAAALRAVRSRRPPEAFSAADLMAWPASSRARIEAGTIRCDDCGEPADTVHVLPWTTHVEEVRAACPAHDPDGYWFPIADLAGAGFGEWLTHLARKQAGGGVVALLRWLGPAGVKAVSRVPAAAS